MRAWRRVLSDDRVALAVIALLSLTTALLLATAGRFPAVDLPQHALILRRLLEDPSTYYETRWSTPYLLFFGLCMPLVPWFGAVQAVWIGMACAIALLPLASALLAKALGRSPWLGVFALLGAFSTPVAWGFASLVLGTSLLALAAATALYYARAPDHPRGLALALLLLLNYFAHSVTWTLSVALCGSIVLVYARTFRPRTLLPALLATALCAVLAAVWLGSRVTPWAQRALQANFHSPNPTLGTRLATLVFDGAALGRTGALAIPWIVLAALFLTAAVVCRSERRALAQRARRLRWAQRSQPLRMRVRRWLRRNAPVAIICACLAGYLFVPLWVDGVLLVYPRFLLFAAVLAPLALGARATSLRALALIALVPGAWLVLAARAEVAFNAQRTACYDRVAAQLRPDEALLELPLYFAVPGYSQPVDLHLAAEAIARRGGYTGFDFSDLNPPVAYRRGVDRLIAPPSLVWRAKLYDHARQGREFTAWLAMGAPAELGSVLAPFAEARYQITRCGGYALVVDGAVPAGSKPHEVFLPHAGHGPDGCRMGMHGPASLEPRALFAAPGGDL